MKNGTIIFLVLFSALATVFFTLGSGSYFWNKEISRESLLRVAVADTISLFGSTALGAIYHQWRKEQPDYEEPSRNEDTSPYTGD
jgi:drug/metabolite transporter (DMT)-like permease